MLVRLALLISSLTLVAQDVQETLQVVVRDIRVHVVDRDGEPITGLRDLDFVLQEGGELRELVYFEEVDRRLDRDAAQTSKPAIDLAERAAELPVAADRAMVLFLDTSNIHKPAFDAVLGAAREIIARETADGTRVKLVHFDDVLHDLSPFSRDGEMLDRALDNVVYRGRFLQKLRDQQERVMRANDDLQAALQRGEAGGFIESLELNLNIELSEKERLKMNHYRAYHFHMDMLSRSLAAFPEAKSIFHLSGGIYLEAGQRQTYGRTSRDADLLAKLLNQRGVTVYSLLQTDIRPIGSDVPRRFATDYDAAITGGYSNSLYEDGMQLQSGPFTIAERTGGFFARAKGLSTTDEKLRRLQNASRHYYRLVYTLDRAEARNRVKVSLARKIRGAEVVFGKEFARTKPFARWDELTREVDFESKLRYDPSMRNDLDTDFYYRRFAAADSEIAIPVTVDLPLEARPEKGYELGLAAFGDDDYVLDVVKTKLANLPDVEGLRLYHVLVTEQDPVRLRFFLRNLDTGAYALHEERLKTSFDNPEHFHISEVMVTQDDHYRLLALNQMVDEEGKAGEQEKKRRWFWQKKKAGPVPDRAIDLRKQVDPLAMAGYLVHGKPRDSLEPGKPVELFFHLYHMDGEPDAYAVKAWVTRNEARTSLPIEIVDRYQPEPGTARYRVRTPDLALATGDYTLILQAFHRETGQAHSREIPLSISRERGSAGGR